MHHIVIAAVAAMAAACATTRPPSLAAVVADRPVVLAVVTWNLHAGRADLPQFVDDLTAGRITGAPVREFVLLLQENISGSDTDALALAARRQWWGHSAPLWQSEEGASGIAMIGTRRPFDLRTIDLPRERRVRRATIAQFEYDGRRLFIVNTHFENRTSWLQGGFLSDSARERQAQALLRALPAGPGILGGDLNTWLGEEEPSIELLLTRFTDTPPGLAEPTFRDRLALDHLLFDLPEGWEAVRRIVRDKYGSDHHPVIGLVVPAGVRS